MNPEEKLFTFNQVTGNKDGTTVREQRTVKGSDLDEKEIHMVASEHMARFLGLPKKVRKYVVDYITENHDKLI